MNIKFIFLFFCFTINVFGQNINQIRKTVSSINSEKNYQIKVLDNDYFVDKKNEVTDNGQELMGFYKNDKLKKIVHEIGLSNKKIVTQYYFNKGNLIFVLEKRFIIIDENGYLKKPKLFSKRKTYFQGGKIIKDINPNSEINTNFIYQSKLLKKDLKNN
ncbi:hypothetical protein SAMN05421847_2254 [Halpernia humi]|uniref:Uncharacterized protein n=1 Tax=Halpernia humi TaxID=493375 RepID=A0A1H5ZZG0_9FLAO|nr:hypothetical protein [Halpernia humi]SEG41087.1 hypothetical protein SAMN05421847_2254 [Halpernia humi]